MTPTDRTPAIPALPNQAGQANVPGLRKLWLIETRYVRELIDPRTQSGALAGWNLNETGVQLHEDAVIQLLKFPSDRGDYKQSSAVSVQGVVYAQSIALRVPNDHPATALIVQRMTGRKFVAIIQDANGQRKLIGTPKQPLRFLAQHAASPNGYAFSWVCETRQPAYFFTDNGLLDTLGADADFSYGFSYDFFS
ncbi:hypothetical protein GCM10028818_00960 [Spirosoma horti]